MSWPSFLAPSAAWLLLAIVPLVLLYLLKLRRPPQRVPSLVLWRTVLDDQRVNAPLRKLLRSLQLLVQLLLLILLCLAAMQPVIGGGSGGERVVVLLDRSASMAARDAAGAPTRFDVARGRVADRLDALVGGGELALIAFARTAELVHAFSSDARALRAALDGVVVADQGDDLGAGLRMAAALAQTVPVDRVVLVSDGVLPDATEFSLPFRLEYDLIEAGGANVGITRLSASRDPRGGWQLLVVVEGTAAAAPARLRVQVDGAEVAEEPVATTADVAERFVFPIDAVGGDAELAVEVTLEVAGFDALAADNRGLLTLRPPRALRVEVDAGLAACRRAVGAQVGVELWQEGAGEPPDLVIGTDPARMRDDAVGLLMGLPDELGAVVEIDDEGTAVVDWDRGDALLDHVTLDDLVILQRPVWRDARGEAELERVGFEVVVHGDRGPLIVRRGRDPSAALLYAFLFDVDQSTLPYRIAFPVMLANLTGLAMQGAGLREVRALRAGPLPPLAVDAPEGEGFELRGPDGMAQERRAAAGRLLGLSVPRAGWYELRGGDAVERRLGANLLESGETTLRSRRVLQLSELTVRADAELPEAVRPLWPWLALLALPLLLLEWWLFRRRPRAARVRAVGRAA